MLKIATRIREMNFYALMDVYLQGNQENGAALYPRASKAEQLLLAEQEDGDFIAYHAMRLTRKMARELEL